MSGDESFCFQSILETLAETRYRFVHIDVDIYEPTYACLEYFHPRMVEGGLIVIDDYGFPSWPGPVGGLGCTSQVC